MDIFAAWFLWSITAFLLFSRAQANCSWSNEDCSDDTDCCSNSCHKAHEGTNARCRHSMLGEPCVFDYHCSDGLTCGAHYNCCSPYWKMCITDDDCCDPTHVCKSAEGFYYDRCLMRSSAPSSPRSSVLFWTAALLLPLLTVHKLSTSSSTLISQGILMISLAAIAMRVAFVGVGGT